MNKKKIYIDTYYYQYAFSGIGTYIYELVIGLENHGSSEFEYIFSHKLKSKKNYINSEYKIFRLYFHFKYLFWKQFILPIKLILIKPDLLVCLDYILPFSIFNIKQICVFYDAFFWDHHKNYNKYWSYYFKSLVNIGLKNNSTILTISNTAKKNLSKYFKNEIFYVYPTFKPNIFSSKFNVKDFNLEKKKYILHVGSFDKRKNIITLVKAFKKLKSEINFFETKLLIIGKQRINGKSDILNEILDFIKKNDLKNDILLTDYLSDSDLMGLYSNALFYVFPSSDEGFGIPVLECFSNKIPLICSDIPIFKEIALDSALFFKLNDVNELFNNMLKLINSESQRNSLINKGQKRLKDFSRKTFVDEFENIIFQKIT